MPSVWLRAMQKQACVGDGGVAFSLLLSGTDMKKRVLVTGGQGFTGRYLVNQLLQAGDEVFVLKADIYDAEALLQEVRGILPTHVVHLAGISFTPEGKDINVYKVHVIGSENLLKACRELGSVVRKVILVSSSHVYGDRSDGEPINEHVCPAPSTHYAISKYGMECVAIKYAEILPILIVRPFNYTGCRQLGHFLVPKLVRHFRLREPEMELGNIGVARDFSDVRWVAQVYSALLDSKHEGMVNVCSGRAISIRYMLDYLSQKTGHTPKLRQRDELMRQEGDVQVGDRSRLDNWVGIEPYRFEDTLDWMLSS